MPGGGGADADGAITIATITLSGTPACLQFLERRRRRIELAWRRLNLRDRSHRRRAAGVRIFTIAALLSATTAGPPRLLGVRVRHAEDSCWALLRANSKCRDQFTQPTRPSSGAAPARGRSSGPTLRLFRRSAACPVPRGCHSSVHQHVRAVGAAIGESRRIARARRRGNQRRSKDQNCQRENFF